MSSLGFSSRTNGCLLRCVVAVVEDRSDAWLHFHFDMQSKAAAFTESPSKLNQQEEQTHQQGRKSNMPLEGTGSQTSMNPNQNQPKNLSGAQQSHFMEAPLVFTRRRKQK